MTPLLDHSQTLIGVVASFLVLCLYKGEGNFICRIIRSLSANLFDVVRSMVSEFTESAKKENLTGGDDEENDTRRFNFWMGVASDDNKKRLLECKTELQDIKSKVFNDSLLKEQSYKNLSRSFEKQKEDEYISFFLLVQSIIVLAVDSLSFTNNIFGESFIFFQTLISACFLCFLWRKYFKAYGDYGHLPDESRAYKRKKCGRIAGLMSVFASLYLMCVCSNCVLGTVVLIAGIFFVVILMNDSIILRLKSNENVMGLIAGHGIWISIVAFIIAILCGLICKSCDWCLPLSLNLLVNGFQENLSAFFKGNWWLDLYVLYLVFNGFVFPIIFGVLYNRWQCRRIKSEVKTLIQTFTGKLLKVRLKFKEITNNIESGNPCS